MCQNLQINALKIELDAKLIAELMTNSSNSNAVNSAMVADCGLLISQVSQVKVRIATRKQIAMLMVLLE